MEHKLPERATFKTHGVGYDYANVMHDQFTAYLKELQGRERLERLDKEELALLIFGLIYMDKKCPSGKEFGAQLECLAISAAICGKYGVPKVLSDEEIDTAVFKVILGNMKEYGDLPDYYVKEICRKVIHALLEPKG